MSAEIINYTPPPTLREFIKDYRPGELFYDWVVGPVGSGKTTGIFFKLLHMASLQAPSADGIRRTRAVIVRNTMPQLRDTTLTSWSYWFKDGVAGSWHASSNRFILKFGDVECEVLFRPLDTPADVQRVLSLEVTFAILDEFVQIPRAIVDALAARLGRYPSAKDGGATNWGMWGSSNPDTEDNWWFEYLHNPQVVERVLPSLGDPDADEARRQMERIEGRNAKYFHQPSGLGPDAENVTNLPGGRGYYTNQIKGKPDAWVKQFVEAEWGFSVAGQPVIPSFKANMHVAKSGLILNPGRPLVVGLDPGLGGSAMVIGQEDHHGRLLIFGELVQSGMGAQRLIAKLKTYLRARFPNLNMSYVIIAPDPAAANRTQTDEKTVVMEFAKHFKVSYEGNNRLPLRLDAIEHFTTKLTDPGPGLQIDPHECPFLIRALKGGWRYEVNQKKEILKKAEPEDNQYTHVGDACGYLSRYFHRQTEKEMRYGPAARGFRPPRSFGSRYHHQ